MATSSTQLHEEADILSCPLCSFKLKNPKELECRCVFCERCITNHLRSQKHPKCPICKKRLENSKLKDVARPLEMLLTNSQSSRCECESSGCNETVRFPYICVNCQLWLCHKCRKLPCAGVIKEVHTEPGHAACRSKYLSYDLFRILHSNKHKMCKFHEKHFVYFCESCQVCVCEMGKTDKHVGHVHTDLKTKADEYMKMLCDQGSALTEKIEQYKTAKQIYSEINNDSTPKIIDLEECKTKENWCQQRAEKCDCLVRCIIHLEKFACMEVILKIGKDKQEDILEELKLFPLNELNNVYKWSQEKFKLPRITRQDSSRINCVNTDNDTTVYERVPEAKDQQQDATASEAIPDKGQRETISLKENETTASGSALKESKELYQTTVVSEIIAEKEQASTSTSTGIKRTISTSILRENTPGTLKRKSFTGMKRTIQTRSCSSRTNTANNQKDQTAPKRPRGTSIGDDDSTIGERIRKGKKRTKKGTSGRFKRLSVSSIMYADFTLNNTVNEARIAIAQVISKDEGYIDIVNNGCVVEGSELVKDIRRPLHVVVRNVKRNVPQTSSPDCINPRDDGPKISMSCGHMITQGNLYGYFWNQVTTQKSSVLCFAESGPDGGYCDREWLFEEIAKKTGLSNDERVFFESLINQNLINRSAKIQKCPTCGIDCERHDVLNALFVCVNCEKGGKTRFRFCWHCLTDWTDEHTCSKSVAQRMLRDCDRTEISNIRGCPVRRACPKCNNFIEYENRCKYMTCMNKSCKCTFCFVCLCIVGDKGFVCASFDTVCEVAPIQIVT